MAGISSKAAGAFENRKGFNGNEIQNKEFSDGSGINFYDFNARTYDQQLGRFIQIDPLTESGQQESLTPFQFSYDNPVRFNDPDGKCPSCLLGGVIGLVVDAAVQIGASFAKSYANGITPSFTSILNDFRPLEAAAAFGAGFVTQGISVFEQGSIVLTKNALVTASFSMAAQIGTDGIVDVTKTVIDAIPIPEMNVTALSTSTARNTVKRAENSINSSTSKIPARKVAQLTQANNKLAALKTFNEIFTTTVSGIREGAAKEALSDAGALNTPNQTPFTGGHAQSDGTRVALPPLQQLEN